MYKQFFGLRENPFNANPDPRYLFLTPQTQEALDELTYGIQTRKGLILLTGEVGTGKTTLINRLLDWLHQQQTPTVFIFNSHLEASHLFDFILEDFGVGFDSRLKGNALMRLNQWLIERFREGETPVLIVDEAQGLPTNVLEEIRLLLNLETPREKLLQIVLAGQPELEARLKRPELRQIKQRITLRCRTAALNLEEAHDYIRARLHIAGANGKPVFASQAMDAVHFYSRGIPRVMNLLCEHALVNAYVDQIQPVPAHIIEEVAREFQFDDMKPLAPSIDTGDIRGGNLIAMQSTPASALIHLPAADGPLLCQKKHGDSVTNVSAPIVIADAALRSTNEPATPVLNCEHIPALNGAKETFRSLGVPTPALAAPEPGRIEARQPSGSTALVSDACIQLIAELATERAPLGFSPPPHVVEARGKLDLLPVSGRCQLPRPQKPAYTAATANVTKRTPLTSRRMTLLALCLSLTRRSARWRDHFLSVVTWPAWTQRPAILLQQLKRLLHPVRAWYRRCLAWQDRYLTILGSIDWPRMKASAYRWLRQPWNPTQWRFPDSRLFETRHGFSDKKM